LKQILVATRNKKKLSEFKRLFQGSGIMILSLDLFKGMPDVEEDKNNFRDNAIKKATEISARTDKLVASDDSGLEVAALGNEPGVFSARYAGPGQDDEKNIDKLLAKMKGLKGAKRRACFRCYMCLSKGDRIIGVVSGKVQGRIAEERSGVKGFGYDPVFIPNGFSKTFAELGSTVKDRISHRAIAMVKTKKLILKYFQRCV
jgi:XTP/dITP diphosphohydrolase